MRSRQQLEDGVVAEVIFPNTVPAVLSELRAVRPAAQARRVRAPPGRHPGAQPLAGRLLRRVPRAARRYRADLPQRPRRRAGGRQVDRGARPAWRDCCCQTSRPTRRGSSTDLTTPTGNRCGASARRPTSPVNIHGGTGVPDFGDVPCRRSCSTSGNSLSTSSALSPPAPLRGLRTPSRASGSS